MEQMIDVGMISRRSFVRASAMAAAVAMLGGRALGAGTTQPAAGFKVEGGLVTLPAKGTLYIANDFHTRATDFEAWLKQTDLVARLKGDENAYGLVLGDVVDVKPGDLFAEPGGDSKMVEKIRQIQRGPGGNRLIYVMGNHEYEVASIYDACKKQLKLDASNRDRIVQALYNHPRYGEHFQQFNFLERITEEQFEYLKSLPLLVMCGNGLLAVHAGPARKAVDRDVIVNRDLETVNECVWRRPTAREQIDPDEVKQYYNEAETEAFMKGFDSQLMVVGHTPLGSLPKEWIQDGLARVGKHEVVMAASYGALPGQKQYLCIDLGKRYGSSADLNPNGEIRPLEEKQARGRGGDNEAVVRARLGVQASAWVGS